MPIMTKKDLKELKEKLLNIYGQEPSPHSWTKQDIFEGARKIIFEYFGGK